MNIFDGPHTFQLLLLAQDAVHPGQSVLLLLLELQDHTGIVAMPLWILGRLLFAHAASSLMPVVVGWSCRIGGVAMND